MFLINKHSDFKASHAPNLQARRTDYIFYYHANKIGVTHDHKIPTACELELKIQDLNLYCFGHIGDKKCLLLETKNTNYPLEFLEPRYSHRSLEPAFYQAAALGNHMAYWRSNHTYCGQCGSPMIDSEKERARLCTKCHNLVFPRISPCIIVLIKRGRDMLLARSPHFPEGVFSTLAGFIEPGETIEQAVVREVKEEVGVEICHLQYLCSQPWPFPDSLMLGFIADYASGDLHLDHDEIEAASWFNTDHLPPQMPNEMSISRYLIDYHLSNFGK